MRLIPSDFPEISSGIPSAPGLVPDPFSYRIGAMPSEYPAYWTGFTKMPNSVLMDRDLTALAKCVYGVMSNVDSRRRPGSVDPTLAMTAEQINVSLPTIRKAVKELIEHGLIEKTGRKNVASSYRILLARRPDSGKNLSDGGTEMEKESFASRAGGILALSEDKSERAKALLGQSRIPNPAYEALVAVTNADRDLEGTLIGKALSQIRMAWERDTGCTLGRYAKDEQDPQWDMLAAEIRARAVLYQRRWRGVELTPMALARNWTRVTVRQATGRVDFDAMKDEARREHLESLKEQEQ